MKRIDAAGHVANKFTDGDPDLGQQATVVDADWLNQIQEEVCSVIEAAGITLDEGQEDQLLTAIRATVDGGNNPAAPSLAIANNQVVAANVTGLVFDKDVHRAVTIRYSIHRQTDAPTELDGAGEIRIWYKPVAAAWQIDVIESNGGDDHGVVFSVTAAGQIQYTSSNLAGANYSGTLRIGGVTRLKV